MLASEKTFPLLAELLADQQRLQTPVALFASAHAASPASSTLLAPQLIPLSAPKPGEQYAFEVELDSCTGCKACVSACHSLNGLDETETWRDVGLVVDDDFRHPFSQTITTACHHCADPGCLNGCPVLAYEKDPVTGIVRHLDDQCIGCQYCILKCPYDVPKYSSRLGIVRKCDLCHSRLAAGEAPACAQACPTHAIRIVTVPVENRALETGTRKNRSSVQSDTTGIESSRSDISAFLPSAPDPSYTRPTTRYLSSRPLPKNLRPADADTLRPQPAHWPLVWMLTLMPMAVGCSTMALFSDGGLQLTGLFAGIAGLAASVFHLGQPWRAWRVFLNWRRSWLSREAMLFGVWLFFAASSLVVPELASATAVMGVLALFCSVMIYVDTRRTFWRWSQTAGRFFGAALVLGLATSFALGPQSLQLVGALALAGLLKLALEARVLHPLDDDDESPTPARQTARLLVSRDLRVVQGSRVLLTLIGGGLLPLGIAASVVPAWSAWLVLALVFAGELAERYLFFRAVDAPKMPGMPA